MQRKKILFISSWFPNKTDTTAGNFVQRHAEAVALLHDVEILHAIGYENQKEKYVFDDQIINGIRTLIVYYRNTKSAPLNFSRRMRAYKKGFALLQKPDIVHANVLHNSMYFPVFLKFKYKIPFVVTEHWTALRAINYQTTSSNIKRNAKIIANHAAKILPVSKDLQIGLEKLGVKTAMKVIPNVVDTSLFSSKVVENSEYTFIHISNLIPRKNASKILNVALKLFNKGYKFKIQIGGDGDISDLKKAVNLSENSEDIEIFGRQTLEQVATRMRNSDCFILFSDDENQPCVIAEAFASGIPVISTNVGGISEFFPKEAGILLNSVDEKMLEDAMILMMQKKKASNNYLVDYARNQFSKEIIAEEFSKIYEEVLEK